MVGDGVCIHIHASCDETCLNSSMVGLNLKHNYPPRHLALYNPTSCIATTEKVRDCDTYFVDNIMLGQNIKINACVLSLYDQPAEGVDFMVNGENQNYKLDSTRLVPNACNLVDGIGKKVSDKSIFSMSITSQSNNEFQFYTNSRIITMSPWFPL